MGTLYYGDNLEILRKHIKTESVDLIYLDPPFNSDVNYNVIFKTKNKEDSPSQIQAFEDTWKWGAESEMVYSQILGIGDRIADVIKGLREAIGENDMMAYVTMMSIRLIELHRILKPTGSLYLHCDPTASHYLKIILDVIFRPENFKSEIIWRRTGSHSRSLRYAPLHDTILFYTKSKTYTWNFPKRPYMQGHIEQNFIKDKHGYKTNYYGNVLTGSGIRGGSSGKSWRGFNPTKKGRHWAIPKAVLTEINENLSDLNTQEKLDKLFELGYVKIIKGHAWPIYERYLKKR